MIDTHCHLTYQPLCDRLDDVLTAAAAAGVDRMITVGTSPDDARRAAALAQQHPQVFATVGLHPHYAADWTDQAAVQAAMRELAAHPRVVALGEMGLDWHYPDQPRDVQHRVLDWQLETVAALPNLPVIIHNRKATDDVLTTLRRSGIPGPRFVFHCFTGTPAEVDAILDFGAVVGFTGIVTFASATDVAEASDRVPLDRLLIETDSPYLTPEPHRKVRPNEPKYVPHVARFLAHRRGMSEADFIAAVDANARRVFHLPP
jgi:TatD DNase family protein